MPGDKIRIINKQVYVNALKDIEIYQEKLHQKNPMCLLIIIMKSMEVGSF